MDTKKGFIRNFMIFGNEDSGFEAGQKPSGHVRLEVREGRGKLYAVVQNLRPGNGRFIYKLYLLRGAGDSVTAMTAGEFKAEPNKLELEWSFDPSNVGASGCRIEEYGGAVVLVEYADRPVESIICPLAAYKDGKMEWRNGLKKYFLLKQHFLRQERQAKQAMPYNWQNQNEQVKQCTQQQSTQKQELPSPAKGEEQPYQKNPILQENLYGDQPQQEHESLKQQKEEQPQQEHESLKQQKEEQPQQKNLNQELSLPAQPTAELLYQEEKPHQEKSQINPSQCAPSQPDMMQGVPLQYDYIHGVQPDNNQLYGIPQGFGQQPMDYMQTPAMQLNQPAAPYQTEPGEVNTGCVYLNGNMCGAFVNDAARAANPCDTCRMRHAAAIARMPASGDIALLKQEIGRYFEENDPFHSKRSDYIWWKVTNPVNLNNILYQCNIRSPLLFNPAVMMAHYKYRHLIIGIFQHKESQKQYVVCGVPGMHMVDRKPFGEMSRWVQAEGNRSRYGAFGYWLVYIDPDDGKILNLG